jgi:threonine/homoserine/homoserine lactone efflux protein
MITGSRLLEFIVACVIIILAPGPSVMFVIARAIAWGRATALLTALGNALGMLTLASVIALGLGPILQSSDLLLNLVQVFGGLYLIYLGVDALRHRNEHAEDMLDVTGGKPNVFRSLREGYMVGVLNPKALVFFSAVFPQFVDKEVGSITIQMLAFGLIFAILGTLLDGMWGVLVGTSREWFANSHRRLVFLRTAGGTVMVTLGILVIVPLALDQL